MSNNRIQIEVLLGAIFIIASAVVLLVLGFQEETQLASAAEVQEAEAIEAGAKLYELACAECHGEFGQGGLGAPFNDPHFFDLGPEGRLAEVGWGGTLGDFIVSTAAAGRPVSSRPDQYPGKPDNAWAMPTWSQDYGGPFRNDQIRDVAEFILNWGKLYGDQSSAAVDYVDLPAPLSASPEARGKFVFTGVGGCSACHTIEGVSSGTTGPDLTHVATNAATRVPGLSAEEYILQSILEPNAFVVEGFAEGIMPPTMSETLSESQLQDVITYLLGLE
jgi:mono/diheme cytochrome c family protein